MGYVSDEVSRRSAELAIRKVNGASIRDVLLLFIKNISLIALPGIPVGCVVAHFVILQLLDFFVVKVSLPFYAYSLCGLGIYVTIIGITILRSLRVSRDNPIKYLKNL